MSIQDELYRDYAATLGAGHAFDFEAAERGIPVLRHYLRDWLPSDSGARIADLGCGGGRALFGLTRLGYTNCSGVDLSESQLRVARTVCSRVELGDAIAYLRSSEETFDLLLSFDVIEHLSKENALELLRLCFERLAPGGRLILQTPNASSPFFGDVRYGDFTHEIAFTPRLLATLMTRAGFRDVECREQGPVPFGYSAKSTLRAALWRVLRFGLGTLEQVETGARGGVYTRVFLASGRK